MHDATGAKVEGAEINKRRTPLLFPLRHKWRVCDDANGISSVCTVRVLAKICAPGTPAEWVVETVLPAAFLRVSVWA
jgi:hypothetical protein